MSGAPRQLGNAAMLVDDATVQRVRRLISRLGVEEVRARLGVSTHTLDQARGGGRVKRETRDRIVEALDREEAIAS